MGEVLELSNCAYLAIMSKRSSFITNTKALRCCFYPYYYLSFLQYHFQILIHLNIILNQGKITLIQLVEKWIVDLTKLFTMSGIVEVLDRFMFQFQRMLKHGK